MKKDDVEYARVIESGRNFRSITDLIKHGFSVVAYLGALWLIFAGLQKILAGQAPDGITAIAKVVEALKFGSILGYLFGFGAVVGWKRERTGKQRAIREKNRYQKLVEQDDPNRTSSGLGKHGETPTGGEDE